MQPTMHRLPLAGSIADVSRTQASSLGIRKYLDARTAKYELIITSVTLFIVIRRGESISCVLCGEAVFVIALLPEERKTLQ